MMCVVELAGDPLWTRASFGEQPRPLRKSIPSLVSLQACLTGPDWRICFGAAFRARAKEERTISSPQLLFRMYMS